MNNREKFLVLILIMLVMIACGLTSTKTLVFHGISMEPTIVDGEKIFSSPVNLEDLKRGDLIHYIEPITGEELVKRLIGLPGETIEVKDGTVHINGIGLDEPYVKEPATYSLDALFLRSGEYFALGDNRNNSLDSSTLGPIPDSAIIGVILPLGVK